MSSMVVLGFDSFGICIYQVTSLFVLHDSPMVVLSFFFPSLSLLLYDFACSSCIVFQFIHYITYLWVILMPLFFLPFTLPYMLSFCDILLHPA